MTTIRDARRAGCPLVVIETNDMAQTIVKTMTEINGKIAETPVLKWDICNGLQGVNQLGIDAGTELSSNLGLDTQNPTQCLVMIRQLPAKSLVFFLNGHLFWKNETVLQAMWNLRDEFKADKRTLVVLVPSVVTMPEELRNDTVVLSEPLPTMEEIGKIANAIIDTAKSKGMPDVPNRDEVNDILLGVPSAFGVEQVVAMSTRKEAFDIDGLWDRKRKMIEQTPGLSVWRGGETFADVYGYENVKQFMRAICKGKDAPNAIVFIDEIEKSLAGSQSDTSGVSQDQVRSMLTFMQDEEADGVIFIGPAGSGKSAVAKATGNEANRPTIALDLGGMKGSLVGESEARLRNALKVIKAVSQGKMLFIATCNSMGVLPPEMRRRFSLGTFFFPLPSADERKLIWKGYCKKYQQEDRSGEISDTGWTGAEIRTCCRMAYKLGKSLKEASAYIVPVSVSGAEQLDNLCRQSHRKYINASASGLYEYEKLAPQVAKTRTVGD